MHSKCKKTCLVLLLIVVFSALLFAETIISDFHARTLDRNVILEWSTQKETNLQKFRIERSTDPYNDQWTVLGNVNAAGSEQAEKKYSYTDSRIFKGSISSLYYRLGLVDPQGNIAYHHVIASTSGISGIRHTWGSIKAMFR